MMSPKVKTRVMAIEDPSRAFGPTDHTMAFGKVRDASSISSAVSHYRVTTKTSGVRRELNATYTYAQNNHIQ